MRSRYYRADEFFEIHGTPRDHLGHPLHRRDARHAAGRRDQGHRDGQLSGPDRLAPGLRRCGGRTSSTVCSPAASPSRTSTPPRACSGCRWRSTNPRAPGAGWRRSRSSEPGQAGGVGPAEGVDTHAGLADAAPSGIVHTDPRRTNHHLCDTRHRNRWKERSALLAGATGEARVLAGGTDLLVQMRADVVDPALIVDIKKITETRAGHRGKGRLAHRRRGDRGRAQGASPAQAGVAGRDRGGQPHRLDPGPGAGDPGRQPLQRLAGGRQRAGAHRGRSGRHPGRAPGPARPPGRGRHARAPQAGADEGRVRRLLPAAAAPAALERRLPALHPAHRDGHRGRRRGRESHDRRRRARSPPRACRWARWRAGVAGAGGRPGDRRQPSGPRPRRTGSRRPPGRPARRSTTSEERSNSASRSPACWHAARR